MKTIGQRWYQQSSKALASFNPRRRRRLERQRIITLWTANAVLIACSLLGVVWLWQAADYRDSAKQLQEKWQRKVVEQHSRHCAAWPEWCNGSTVVPKKPKAVKPR